MNTIPVITPEASLYTCVDTLTKQVVGSDVTLEMVRDYESAKEYLEIELPELFFIDFSGSAQGGFDLLGHILEDTWLLSGGIIALCDAETDKGRFEEYRGANIIILLDRESIDEELPKVFSIIQKNRRILFQRDIGSELFDTISGSFSIGNDLVEARCYTNLVCNFLYNAGRLDTKGKFNLTIALDEILMNAIEHGNCGITYEQKSELMSNKYSVNGLIRKKAENGDVYGRHVNFEYTLSASYARFTITDQGKGFDWRNYRKATGANQLDLHGRGIIMVKAVVDELEYNETGNAVTFRIVYSDKHSNNRPEILKGMEPRIFNKGETVFRQGEESSYIYFIVKGEYSVIKDNKTLYTLTPDDMFVGEISFLLNNSRSATVKTESEGGKLIPVSKWDFMQKLRERPHYGLFMSRLLARRLNHANSDPRKFYV